MNVASPELCKELWRFSGWQTGTTGFNYGSKGTLAFGWFEGATPAYDLGFMLEQLKATAKRKWSNGWNGYEVILFWDAVEKNWSARFKNTDKDDGKWFEDSQTYGHVRFWQNGDTPEDALCRLAIELFKQGILK